MIENLIYSAGLMTVKELPVAAVDGALHSPDHEQVPRTDHRKQPVHHALD